MFSDCRSLVANLNAEMPVQLQHKRHQVELNAIRQSVFDEDGRRTSEVYPQGGDQVDWLATAIQAADFRFWILVSTRYHVKATRSLMQVVRQRQDP